MSASDEKDDLRRWVECWKAAGPRLEAIRREELRKISTQQALMNLAGAFESARLHFSPSPTSGLVIQQRWFMLAAQPGRGKPAPIGTDKDMSSALAKGITD